MDVQSAIRGRRSIRSYLDTHIEKERLFKVLEAGRLAPSAKNRQEWKFVDGSAAIHEQHSAEAIQYRSLDREPL
jgi:nitroreductase